MKSPVERGKTHFSAIISDIRLGRLLDGLGIRLSLGGSFGDGFSGHGESLIIDVGRSQGRRSEDFTRECFVMRMQYTDGDTNVARSCAQAKVMEGGMHDACMMRWTVGMHAASCIRPDA